MPSSLTRVLSRALEYSSRPPESVCGTDTKVRLAAAFLGSLESLRCCLPVGKHPQHLSALSTRLSVSRPTQTAYRLELTIPTVSEAILLRPRCDNSPSWCRTINLLPIDYAFRPRLRGWLTLRRLALRRNPWSFGESVSHTPYRYSCQHSHFRYLQPTSRLTFTGLRNAPLPRVLLHTLSFGARLEPRYIFAAGTLN